MDATKMKSFARRGGRALVLLPTLALMLVSYQNCSVDLASTTPGASVAANCEPTAQQLTAFEPVLNQLLQAQGTISGTTQFTCGNCHAPSGTHMYASTGRSVFQIQEGDTTANPQILKANFCTIADRSDMLATKILVGPHTGGMFQPSEVQILLTFLDTYF